MTPLDAARKYAKYPDTYESEDETGALEIRCSRCDESASIAERGWPSIVHAPDCPWLSMPKIVAALEAAELVSIAAEEERILFGVRAGSQLVAALEKLDEVLDA